MKSVQSRIKNIMDMEAKEREVALRELASEKGCSLASTYGGDGPKHYEEEVIRRIQEADRSIRESRLWWLAVLSGIASVFSAIAAWVAVIYATGGN